MAHYAIGDLQGCYDELQALLAKIGFNHGTDTLWLTGDIVNRGPKSLEALQFCRKHDNSVQIILGNHDLHLLAIAYRCGKSKRGDTLDNILNHPDSSKMLDWLRAQPLLVGNDEYVMVHAGLLPQWDIPTARSLAAEVEAELSSHRAQHYFAHMYGNKPDSWSPKLNGSDRLRLITNAFTRLRALTLDNKIELDFKSGLADMPSDLRAWFEAPNRQHLSHTILFGHWSALGYLNYNNVVALDTGALWGGSLTAYDLNRREVTQIDAINGLNWRTTLN